MAPNLAGALHYGGPIGAPSGPWLEKSLISSEGLLTWRLSSRYTLHSTPPCLSLRRCLHICDAADATLLGRASGAAAACLEADFLSAAVIDAISHSDMLDSFAGPVSVHR